MSGADHTRPTRRFDLSQFAKLARKDEPLPPQSPSVEPLQLDNPPEPPGVVPRGTAQLRARRNPIEDPMTTQLLAAVARSRETIDFDEEVVDEAVENLGSGDTGHPHTRRRTR